MAGVTSGPGRLLAGLCLVAALALPLGAATLPAAAKSRAIEIVDFGIYTTRHVRMEKAPKQIAGEREVVRDVRLLRKTRKFAAQIGRTFGYRYRLVDPSLDGKVLIFRLIYPRLTNPKTGRTMTHQDMPQRVRLGVTGFEGYGFDHRWELGEGIWTMQIIHNGAVLSEQKFHVLVPLN